MLKHRSTFFYMMGVNVIIMLLCFALLFGAAYFTIRDIQINNRVAALKGQAYDIAELAGYVMSQQNNLLLSFGNSPVKRLLEQKTRRLYEDYSAYCLVVDRSGQGSSYFLSILDEHQELKTTFDAESIATMLQKVLEGNEIVTQMESSSGPMFTVAVPLVYAQRVIGGVYIQTAAQSVHQAYRGLGITIGLSAIALFVLAAVISWRFNKKLTEPLREMAKVSRDVAAGHFGQTVSIDESGAREMTDLSVAFNLMSNQLAETEQVRRDFIANVSHELSSPITNIQGFIAGVLDGTITSNDTEKYLGIALDETKRISKLVSGLLNLSKMENGQALSITTFDIHELIRLVSITMMSAMEAKKHELFLNFHEEPLYVSADRDKIEQVLINLLDNAVKYTPEYGQISVLTREIDDRTASVTIKDNGIGILPEDIPHVFERFYMAEKAHTSGKGTGLGLAICRRILENHGQQITVASAGEGTAFEFTLNKEKASRKDREANHAD